MLSAVEQRFATLSGMPCAFVTMEHGAARYGARSTSLRWAGAGISPPESPSAPWLTASVLLASAPSKRARFHKTSGTFLLYLAK